MVADCLGREVIQMVAVQRINFDATPSRFEWLVATPSFVEGTPITIECSWTADHSQAHDFDEDDAADWAEALEATVVRFGDSPAQRSTQTQEPEAVRLSNINERMERRKRAAAAVDSEGGQK
jgi:hypothetical protein